MEWIKCNERMPDDNEIVLVFKPNGNRGGGIYDMMWGSDVNKYTEQGFIVYWLPLPKPPKEGQDEL